MLFLLMFAPAHAASLGKIEVASHLGEPFYARIPLLLSAGETASSFQVGIADLSDYRILEVYRDPVVGQLQVRLKTDEGPYLEVTSDKPVRSGFFNLIIRLTHDRLTQFKKFPVFLELTKAPHPATAAAGKQVERSNAVAAAAAMPPRTAKADAREKKGKAAFEPYDGWARAAVYGPIVRGDMLSTIAQRLRIDDRYTLAQVVVALFEKNRDKFAADNFNLLKAGSMLKVPTAAEVERHSPREASRIFDEHLRRWKEMVKHSRMAAEEKRAQEQRYKPRIRMGAAVVESTPTAGSASPVQKPRTAEPPSGRKPAEAKAAEAPAAPAMTEGREASPRFQAAASEEPHQEEARQLPPAETAASDATRGSFDEGSGTGLQRAPVIDNQALKSVQLQLQQLQMQLAAMQQQRERDEVMLQWILTGIAAVILVMLLGLLVLLRRERAGRAFGQLPSAGPEPVSASSFHEAAGAHETVSPIPAAAPTSGHEAEEKAGSPSAVRLPDADRGTDAQMSADRQMDTGDDDREPARQETARETEVDHLAEADVYLRYGMESEALKMVEQALQLDPRRLEAHVKKALVLSFLGDEQAVQASIREGLSMLPPEEHGRFLEALRELDLKIPEPSAAEARGGHVSDGDEKARERDESEDEPAVDAGRPPSEEKEGSSSADEAGTNHEEHESLPSDSETSAAAEQELDFDLTGFDPEAEDVRPAALTPSRLAELAGDEALDFDFAAADEAGSVDAGMEASVEAADADAADGRDDAEKLDRLLRQLDEEDERGRDEA